MRSFLFFSVHFIWLNVHAMSMLGIDGKEEPSHTPTCSLSTLSLSTPGCKEWATATGPATAGCRSPAWVC